MIGEGVHHIAVKTTACANGETFEYRLLIGGVPVGKSVFLSGNPTPGQTRHALFALLGLHETQ